ncbi:Fis family two component sigma54 specific transcriptional regulator [Alishewanella agri BL06]|jgi:two-component system NtrC family response regulator|uniref:Fis family two component sigma54 specific transcriptional regulator n=1 Tax=Alishewanella agri BL06 TaxID=1195246 RepID=I9P1C5_9ALTE|nr:sigma-54 dependent transcriptional regulator [Alishewanella agri]EIW88677.1 Fis family two component sigma54 specific transcriptional regulator [Alishewanella agri BL06]
MTERLLVVEDDAQQRQLLCELLRAEDYQVQSADSVETAILALKQQPLDLVLCDWKLGQGSGLQVLQYLRQHYPQLGFVVATAYGSVSHAVEAIQAGADDYLTKPFKRQELLLAISKGLSAWRLRQQNQQLTEQLSEQQQLVELIGHAPCMQQLFQRINRISASHATVLISGESGTGKELAARALHQLSGRKGPFIAINCGAIPEQLAEAELFGAEKGAYTGAHQSKAGKFEAANGGTLFLDEVAELPAALQAKLLRLLQEGKVTRLGSHQEISLDVRLIAASHQDLALAVQEGRFREDLFYRLNVVPLHMPALRERREDIPRLIQHFLQKSQQRYQLPAAELSKAALRQLMDYPWPGNVRELANRIERFVLLADERELLADLNTAATVSSGFVLPAEGLNWQQHERDCLLQALSRSNGNRAQAAKLLQLPYKAFLYRLEKYQLG